MGAYGDQNTPKEVMLLLSKNIVALRKEKKMTQQELSERSGVAYASVRKFEKTGVISLESLLKICETLNRLTDFETILIPNDMDRKRKLFDY
ncbi:MAG: helix-turn-helix transcriptional regulator [Crocinitomicaceae bacterium]|nr:helix-turn-helix transcriptional regulator [Crocinitomicaceae bacterium]